MKVSANAKRRGRRIYADEEFDEPIDDIAVDEGFEDGGEDAAVDVDEEAMGLLFEAEDVAELIAEVTEGPVEVAVDDESVVFTVGEDEFTVTPEGDEEILEAVRRPLRNKRVVRASTARRPATRTRRPATRRPVQSSRTTRPVRSTSKPAPRTASRPAQSRGRVASCNKPATRGVKSSTTIKKYPKR